MIRLAAVACCALLICVPRFSGAASLADKQAARATALGPQAHGVPAG